MGSPPLAAETAMDAADAYSKSGHLELARVARHRAAGLLALCEGSTPGMAFVKADEPDPLTPREREIAMMAARGLTSRQIAIRLHLSIRTVDNHLAHVFGKLGLAGRQDLQSLVPIGTRNLQPRT
jgi:DNA-binding CsgD family transcriptional regulator